MKDKVKLTKKTSSVGFALSASSVNFDLFFIVPRHGNTTLDVSLGWGDTPSACSGSLGDTVVPCP
jgi:hypothetical protein